jgi:hypothetical protein
VTRVRFRFRIVSAVGFRFLVLFAGPVCGVTTWAKRGVYSAVPYRGVNWLPYGPNDFRIGNFAFSLPS